MPDSEFTFTSFLNIITKSLTYGMVGHWPIKRHYKAIKASQKKYHWHMLKFLSCNYTWLSGVFLIVQISSSNALILCFRSAFSCLIRRHSSLIHSFFMAEAWNSWEGEQDAMGRWRIFWHGNLASTSEADGRLAGSLCVSCFTRVAWNNIRIVIYLFSVKVMVLPEVLCKPSLLSKGKKEWIKDLTILQCKLVIDNGDKL